MSLLPGGIDPSDEIDVTWEDASDGVVVEVVMGEVTIMVGTPHGDGEKVAFLATALPGILANVWDSIEKGEA